MFVYHHLSKHITNEILPHFQPGGMTPAPQLDVSGDNFVVNILVPWNILDCRFGCLHHLGHWKIRFVSTSLVCQNLLLNNIPVIDFLHIKTFQQQNIICGFKLTSWKHQTGSTWDFVINRTRMESKTSKHRSVRQVVEQLFVPRGGLTTTRFDYNGKSKYHKLSDKFKHILEKKNNFKIIQSKTTSCLVFVVVKCCNIYDCKD